MAIADDACIGQIAQFGGAAVFATDDVIDLMRKADIILVNQAILATKLRAAGYAGA